MSRIMPFRGEQSTMHLTNSLEDRCQALERRLDEGYSRIEAALEAGQDVTTWERFWIDLLHEYEAVCNQVQQAA